MRSTVNHSLSIGSNVLIGPNAHVVGCTIEDNVFIETGAAIFHGAKLCKGSEVAIGGVVHIKTMLPENASIPLQWIAVGNPAQILPPNKHEEIWRIQKKLDFSKYFYKVDRDKHEKTNMNMPDIMQMMTATLESHKDDSILE